MRFKLGKCNMMQITRKRIKKIRVSYIVEGTVPENVEIIKYFGITITNDLRWNTKQKKKKKKKKKESPAACKLS